MTQEEKLELIKALSQGGKTEIVLEKNVEYEIGNVEAGGIGVQINQGSNAIGRKDGRKKTSGGSRILDAVFKYTFLDDEESGIRIVKLYQYLIKAEWLEKDTKVDDFRALFLGEPKSFTMKWKGSQQDLYYLIKRLHARKLIQCPKGATKWVITGSHFVDADSRPFTDWNKQKDPVKSARAIERLCDVLDITVPLEEFKSR